MIYNGEYKNIDTISWNINRACNFKCTYCSSRNSPADPSPVDLNNLTYGLKTLGKNWLIHISGGEPFLEKNITEICQIITSNHYLSINTNLSTKNIFDFASTINPERTLSVNASVHITEREKRTDGIRSYIEKMLLLQEKRFNVVAYYVAYPELLDRIKSDFEILKTNGIKKVRLKVFKGIYDNKYYPYSFNAGQRKLLESLESDYLEIEILNEKQHYRGKLCRAGRNFFVMDRAGNLLRCSGLNRSYGNLFAGSIKYDEILRPCPVIVCGCPYEGIKNFLPAKANRAALLKEVFIEKYLKFYSILKNPRSFSIIKNKSIEFLAKHR